MGTTSPKLPQRLERTLGKFFGPPGPTGGPGSTVNGSGSKRNPGCAQNQPRGLILRPVRWQFCFLGWPGEDTQIKDKTRVA
jgi:hypothetical protein